MATDLVELSPDRFINRELSWLEFNSRVLAQAEDTRLPLLERVKFVAIHASNLDEFFQVRVAGLKGQVAAGLTRPTHDGLSPRVQLSEIRDLVDAQLARVAALWRDDLGPSLAEAGICITSWTDLDVDDRKYLGDEFENRIFPILTPLAVDLGRPFPFISNLSLNLGVILRGVDRATHLFARVKVPNLLDRFLLMPDGERVVPVEQVIAAHLDLLFPGMETVDHVVFRVTRNADLAIDEGEAEDLLEAVEMELRRRRFRSVVRLEVEGEIAPEARDLLVDELDIEPEDVSVSAIPLDLAELWELYALDRPDLKEPEWSSVTAPELRNGDEQMDVFAVLSERDVLVHHPYTSFSTSVQEFIRQAAHDPRVLALKLTLYRTDGDSPIIESLVHAAEQGKQVAVVVELKARFDEEANIGWARRLERAGVHVAYGLLGLKVHAKTCLVVRDEPAGIRRYCHIGTGNYNSKTARLYEDVGLLTANREIGRDVGHLFNFLTGYGSEVDYEHLLVAPHHLRTGLQALIDGETALGPEGRIVLKMNSLVDPELIDALYLASQAGVPIDLIIRGICCLRPGVPELSETIRVRSLIGRYLEHSRVYAFANGRGRGEPTYLIGSGDWMPRNLDGRIEALCPVLDPDLQARLDHVLATCLADDQLAWELDADGNWTRVVGDAGINTHDALRLDAESQSSSSPRDRSEVDAARDRLSWLRRIHP